MKHDEYKEYYTRHMIDIMHHCVTNIISDHKYEFRIYSKYPFCLNTNTILFMCIIQIFKYFGTHFYLNANELDKYSFKA